MAAKRTLPFRVIRWVWRKRTKYFRRGRILSGTPNVYRPRRDDPVAKPAMERMMKRTLIRYKTKPEVADTNAEQIAGVFAELKTAKGEGVRYLSLRLDAG